VLERNEKPLFLIVCSGVLYGLLLAKIPINTSILITYHKYVAKIRFYWRGIYFDSISNGGKVLFMELFAQRFLLTFCLDWCFKVGAGFIEKG